MIEWLQKFVPWASGLPVPAKAALSVVVVGVGGLMLALVWSAPVPRKPVVSRDKIIDMLLRLTEIQAGWDARWREVEPLANRARELIGVTYPDQARAIEHAQQTYPSVEPIAQELKTQLEIVRDKLDN